MPEVNLDDSLLALADSREASINWPYLQILHWCCMPIEFFDHPTSYLYEFHPRGEIAQTLFLNYQRQLSIATANPILNNAKAVQTLNTAWARNRGGDAAQALVSIVGLLESLPFGVRRQVGQILRAWLHRIIELNSSQIEPFSGPVSSASINRVVDAVCKRGSKTQGVLEQRVVDCLSFLAFGRQGWRAKGIGDSINASNFSKHKLGDVEFANIAPRKAIAVEAHGGYLSAVYVEGHRRSLSRIIEMRLAESWSAIDEPANWSIKVFFVAHSFERREKLPRCETICDVRVHYKYWTYGTLKRLAYRRPLQPLDISEVFYEHLIQALNQPTVRQEVRETFTTLAKP